jgi:hypothetical protein
VATILLPPFAEPIAGNLQMAWFLKHEHHIPPRIRPLCRERFRENIPVHGDGIFRKLLSPEGEAYLLRDMDEEEADWWVYWLVSRFGFELAESLLGHIPSRVVAELRRHPLPGSW